MELYFPFWNFFGVFCPVGTLRAKSPKVPLLQHLWVTLGRSKKSFRQCIGSKLEGSSRTQCQIPKWYCIFHLLENLSFFPMKSLTNSLSHCNYFWWYSCFLVPLSAAEKLTLYLSSLPQQGGRLTGLWFGITSEILNIHSKNVVLPGHSVKHKEKFQHQKFFVIFWVFGKNNFLSNFQELFGVIFEKRFFSKKKFFATNWVQEP